MEVAYDTNLLTDYVLLLAFLQGVHCPGIESIGSGRRFQLGVWS